MNPTLSLLFLVLWTMRAGAVTYYCDPATGSDSSAGTSTSSPWAHVPGSVGFIGSGWVMLQNGDKLVVKGGSVNNVKVYFRSSTSGSGDAPAFYNGTPSFDSIVVQSGHLDSPQWGTTQAIISGGYVRPYGVGFESVRGVTLDGFEIRNIAPCAGCTFGGGGNANIEFSGPASFITIRRCWLHDSVRAGDDQGHGIEGAQAGTENWIIAQNHFGPNIGTKGIELFRMSYGAVSNNFLEGCGDHYISLGHTTNVDISGNFVFMDYSTGTNGPAHSSVAGINITDAFYVDVWNNVVYATRTDFNSTKWAGGGLADYSSYGYAFSNRVVHNDFSFNGNPRNDGPETAIMLQKETGSSSIGDTNYATIFQNNVAYLNTNFNGGVQWCLPKPNFVAKENVQFNVFWGGGGAAQVTMGYRPVGGSGGDVNTTVASYNPPSMAHTYANNVQSDPVLIGGTKPTGVDTNYLPNTAYFALNSGSPVAVVKSGNPISGDSAHGWSHAANKFALDIAGATRLTWSMGAYEFGGVVVPPITNVPPVITNIPPVIGIVPAPPSNLAWSLVLMEHNTALINLDWDASPTPGVSYLVYSSGLLTKTATTNSTAMSLKANTTFAFSVTAFSANGESAPSGTLVLTTPKKGH